MTVYFCLEDLFTALADGVPGSRPANVFAPVSLSRPDDKVAPDDVMTLVSTPNLLDFGDPGSCYALATLLDENPVYRQRMILMFDDILTRGVRDRTLKETMARAFGGHPLPPKTGPDRPPDIATGDVLKHGDLDRFDTLLLCRIYLAFLAELERGHDEFSFEKFILGGQPEPFQKEFDGYIFAGKGKVRADILIGFGVRMDTDQRQKLGGHMESGWKKALAMRIGEEHELLWAWLEADDYEMRRCHDIHRILSVNGLPRIPNWVRADVLNCAEKETLKAGLAHKLAELDPGLALLEPLPMLEASVRLGIGGQMDASIEALLGCTDKSGKAYDGSADIFYKAALERQRESRLL